MKTCKFLRNKKGNTMKMKKLAGILLSMTLFASCLTGCSSQSAEDAPAPAVKETSDSAKNSADAAGTADASSWTPNKNITIIVPWAAGGGADVLMRAFANTAEKYAGTTFIIQNETGAGGVTGTATASIAPNDGYTIVIAQTGPMVTQRVMSDLPYNPIESFDYIGQLAFEGILICVQKDSPYQTLDDLVAAGKDKELMWSCSSVGSVGYFFGANFALENGMQNRVLPCAGGAEAVTNLMGGQVDYAVVQPSEISGSYESGDIVVLGLGEAERNELYPDMPTLLELGYEGYENMGVLRALALPAGAAPEVMDWYVDLCQKVCADEEFQETCKNASVVINWQDSSAVTGAFTNDYEVYSQLADQLGIVE